MALEEAPPFWWRKPGLRAWLLSPLSAAWGAAAARRMEQEPAAHVRAPVLCIGNFIVGGAGKTPTAIEFARAAIARGLKPGFLSRGYGGHVTSPTQVDLHHHRATDVGDEPLLLAREAVTVVSPDRPAGAEMLLALGCDMVIMDDGFQNPKLHKDFSLIVTDARRGIGNGFTMPAGPLRVPLVRQLARADAVLVIGDGPGAQKVIRKTARSAKPVYLARTIPESTGNWEERRLIAFAGIADPTKFFDTLKSMGSELVETRSYPDHHIYTGEEAGELLARSDEQKAELVTTSKDHVRLAGLGKLQQELAARAHVLDIRLEFDDPRTVQLILDETVKRAEARISLRR
ncbi:MAG: tetraacyldisaccharide 4'-kinase [Nitratireductor sp.]|nr:tetraacyldisaccharide 4'-kinase [Nitratireductor sp.]